LVFVERGLWQVATRKIAEINDESQTEKTQKTCVDAESGVRRLRVAIANRRQFVSMIAPGRRGHSSLRAHRTNRCWPRTRRRGRVHRRGRRAEKAPRAHASRGSGNSGSADSPQLQYLTGENRERDTPFDRDGDVQTDQVRACHLPLFPRGRPRRRSRRVARASRVPRARRLRRRVRRASAPVAARFWEFSIAARPDAPPTARSL
jgi:hypothetical protein